MPTMLRWVAIILSLALTTPLAADESIVVSIACLAAAGAPPSLHLTVANDGDAPTTLLLGTSFANGRWYDLRDLTLLLTTARQADTEEFPYRSRQAPTAVAGRIDHWTVALPPNSSYSQNLELIDFFSPVRGVRLTEVPMSSQLVVRLVGRAVTADLNLDMTGLQAVRYWTGTATSTRLTIPDDCR